MTDLIDLKQVKNIHQQIKDIVYGYIKNAQLLFDNIDDNPYFIIAQLIKDICLIYYHEPLNTKLLTQMEIKSFINVEYKLLYRLSEDGHINDDKFVQKI